MLGWGGTEKEKQAIEKIESEILNFKNVETIQKYEIGSTTGTHTGPVYCIGIVPKKQD